MTNKPKLMTTLMALAAGLVLGCADSGGPRKLGANCGNDAQCASEMCWNGVCVDPDGDEDLDSLANGFERAIGADPNDPDSDGDGARDRDELGDPSAPTDTDGDGLPDIIESLTNDPDGDCIGDQLDAENDVYGADLEVIVPYACTLTGVCETGRDALVVACDPDAVAHCAYDAVPGWEAEETSCDGLDNDCDGAVDEGFDDLDEDDIADCVDSDIDGDGVVNETDGCPLESDPEQLDSDLDGLGDLCDPPTAPSIRATDPVSPAASLDFAVLGDADPFARISIFSDDTCEDQLGEGDAGEEGAFEVPVSLDKAQPDGVIALYGWAANAGGLVSDCVGAEVVYRIDTTPPAPAAFVGSEPESPATNPSPTIFGSAEAGAVVTLSLSADCAEVLATAESDADGAFAIELELPLNTITTVYAQVADPAGNISPCEVLTSWSHDDTPPVAPTGVVDPPGPSRAEDPEVVITGCHEDGASVLVFTTPDCSGEPAATTAAEVTGSCSAGAPYALRLTMPVNAVTPLGIVARDAVGLDSPCVALGDWIHDDIAPSDPELRSLEPGPMGNSATVTLTFAAEPEVAVELFDDGSCDAAPARSAIAGEDGVLVLELTVGRNTVTTLHARARDVADNLSSCQLVATYTHDDIAPNPPALDTILPGLIGSTVDITLVGSAEAESLVRVYTDNVCEAAPFGVVTSGAEGKWELAGAVAPNTTTTFYATATDAIGNASWCKMLVHGYRHDDTPPSVSNAFFRPAPPNPDPRPDLVVCAAAAEVVSIYPSASCEDELKQAEAVTDAQNVGLGACPNNSGALFAELAVAPNASTAYWVIITDLAGNASDCTSVGGYRHDDRAPGAPILTALEPGATGAVPPTLSGRGEADAELELYRSDDCTGSLLASATIGGGGTWELSPALNQGKTALSARVRDDAGNASECSSFGSYTYDSEPPAAPIFLGKMPAEAASPSATVRIEGFVASEERNAGTTVEVFRDRPDCTSTAAGDMQTAAIGATTYWIVTFDISTRRNRTLAFYGQTVDVAGNRSECLFLTNHTHDDVPPGEPGMTPEQQEALAAQNTRSPTLEACAEAGATLTVYSDGACRDMLATATAGTSTCPSGESASAATIQAAANSEIDIYGRATDDAGNRSACTYLDSYLSDSEPPAAPVLGLTVASWDDSGGDNVTFDVTWTTGESAGAFQVFTSDDGSGCMGSAVAEADVGEQPLAVLVRATEEVYLSARVVDLKGNLGACSEVSHVVGEAFFDLSDSTNKPLFGVPVAVHRPDGSLHLTTATQDFDGRARASVYAFEGVMATAWKTSGSDPVTNTLLTAELEPGMVVYHRDPQASISNPTYGYLRLFQEAGFPEPSSTVLGTVGCADDTFAVGDEQPFVLSYRIEDCLSPFEADVVLWAYVDIDNPLGYAMSDGEIPTTSPPGTDVFLPDWKYDHDVLTITLESDEAASLSVTPDLSTFTAIENGSGSISDPAEFTIAPGETVTRKVHYVPDLVAGYAVSLTTSYSSGERWTSGSTYIHREGAIPSARTLTFNSNNVWLTAATISDPYSGEARPTFTAPADANRVGDIVTISGRWTLGDPNTTSRWTMVLRPRAGVDAYRFPELPANADWTNVAPDGFSEQAFAEIVVIDVDAPGWESYRAMADTNEGWLFVVSPRSRDFSGSYAIRRVQFRHTAGE